MFFDIMDVGKALSRDRNLNNVAEAGTFSRAYRNLSFAETLNLTELENRLARGWLPRDVT